MRTMGTSPGRAAWRRRFGAALIMVGLAVPLWGRGLPSGDRLTNANRVDRTNNPLSATNSGDLSASYSNMGGPRLNAWIAGPTVVVRVTNGHDLSVWHATVAHTQHAAPGGVAVFSNSVTNLGNLSDILRIRVQPLGVSAGWLAADTYDVNGTQGSNIDAVSPPLAPDVAYALRLRVKVPASTADGATNRFRMILNNSVGTASGVGDGWPGNTAPWPDPGNLRDHQVLEFLVRVSAPVLRLSKTVDHTATRPFQELTYTIFVSNVGSGTARGVLVQDIIPENTTNVVGTIEWASNSTTYIPKTDAPGDADQAGIHHLGGGRTAVRGRWSELPPGTYGSLRFRVRVR